MVRKVLIGALMLVAVLAAPAAAQYPDFVITPPDITPGGTVTFRGSGCAPGETVTLTINGDVVATATADPTGDYSSSFTVNLPAGNYTVVATCGDVVNTHPLNVRGVSTGRPSGTGGAPLARTGSDSNTLALVGAGLLVLGGGAMVIGRKRFA